MTEERQDTLHSEVNMRLMQVAAAELQKSVERGLCYREFLHSKQRHVMSLN